MSIRYAIALTFAATVWAGCSPSFFPFAPSTPSQEEIWATATVIRAAAEEQTCPIYQALLRQNNDSDHPLIMNKTGTGLGLISLEYVKEVMPEVTDDLYDNYRAAVGAYDIEGECFGEIEVILISRKELSELQDAYPITGDWLDPGTAFWDGVHGIYPEAGGSIVAFSRVALDSGSKRAL